MKSHFKILLAEDEPNFGTVLKSYLSLANYKVDWCADGKEAYSKFASNNYDLCVLDVMMPEMDGFTLAKEIRKKNQDIPIIFLTAKSLKEDVLKGFKIGADDYLTKPFDSDILLEKLKVLLKRNQSKSAEKKVESIYNIGNFKFNPSTRTLEFQNEIITLSPKESALLIELCKHKNQVMSRSNALELIWNEDNYFTARSMDVYIAKLRKYLRKDDSLKIVNIHGNGFQLIQPD